jgi:hypothetical protein
MALLHPIRSSTHRRLLPVVLSAVAFVVPFTAPSVHADDAVTRALDGLDGRIGEDAKAWRGLFDAYLDMSDCPVEISADFGQVDVWPGMEEWAEIGDWASSNAELGDAMKAAADKLVLGLPYGDDGVTSADRDAGLVARVQIGAGGDLDVEFPYLQAFRTFSTWSAAEMYRRFERGDYREGFDVAIANLRVLRMLCDRHMAAEKQEGMMLLIEALSVLRDAMYAYVDRIPADEYRRVSMTELPFLRTGDAERFRRLQMPEGDRYVVEAMLEEIFGGGSSPDAQRLGEVLGRIQSEGQPLTRFGASKRWERIADVHGSLEASQEKLTNIYDDWWRRWRIRPYDPIQKVPTEFSMLNEVRYAIIAELVPDLIGMFETRNRLIAELNGTILSGGICGYRSDSGTWPDIRAKFYATFAPQRCDFDPFDEAYGTFLWYDLGSAKQAVDTDYGRIEVDECVLYARGQDHADSAFKEASLDGLTGDMIMWPPLRQLARDQDLID